MKTLTPVPEVHPEHPRMQLRPFHGPGLFITATGTDVGKTTVTAAMAGALHRLHMRVGVCKPVASGCPKYPERGNDPQRPLTSDDLMSPDAMTAGAAAGLDAEDPSLLRYLSPVRFAAPISPHLASQIEGRPTDWKRVATALDWWQENCDVLLVEGAGGWCVPLDQHDFMVADLATALRLPVLVVTGVEMGTLNSTLLTVQSIRQRGLVVAGLVINRVPGQRDLLVETNLQELPRLCGAPVRGILPVAPEMAEQRDKPGAPVAEALIDAMMPFAKGWLTMHRAESATQL